MAPGSHESSCLPKWLIQPFCRLQRRVTNIQTVTQKPCPPLNDGVAIRHVLLPVQQMTSSFHHTRSYISNSPGGVTSWTSDCVVVYQNLGSEAVLLFKNESFWACATTLCHNRAYWQTVYKSAWRLCVKYHRIVPFCCVWASLPSAIIQPNVLSFDK